MSKLNFIIQGKNAADTALDLKRYIQSEWKPEGIRTNVRDSPTIFSTDSHSKGFDPNSSIEILLQAYGIFKAVKDGLSLPEELADTKEKLANLALWLEGKITDDYNIVWLQINGIPYAIKTKNLDEIVKALEKQE